MARCGPREVAAYPAPFRHRQRGESVERYGAGVLTESAAHNCGVLAVLAGTPAERLRHLLTDTH